MSKTPVARYTIILDRYCTEDADGTGLYHDGTGEAAAKQVADELQEAINNSGQPCGHFRVINRHVFDSDDALPGGYGARDLPQSFMDDPKPEPPPLVECVQCASRDVPEHVPAATLAPRIKTCPSPADPDAPWTFYYVAICDNCTLDWWGVGEHDRPECAPPIVPLPQVG